MAIPRKAELFIEQIKATAKTLGRRVRIMEVCGTHTHAIGKGGLRPLLSDSVEIVSGPGCPVCVTSQRDIERMLHLANIPNSILCTFGDMLRVPGITSSLEQQRARGADIRVVYSATDAFEVAKTEPEREVIFLSVGFETTAPGIAVMVKKAEENQLANFSIIPCHKLIVPAMEAVLQGESRIDGFITPGHVSVIIGPEAYEKLAQQYSTPCVATGFDPLDVLEGMAMLLRCIAERRYGSFVQYTRAIKPGGNPRAMETIREVFDVTNGDWRGLGIIPDSGLALKPRFARFDAATRFNLPEIDTVEIKGCRCGEVLKGLIHPPDCPLFGAACTPNHPIGPCMVSSEGSCSARYKYG